MTRSRKSQAASTPESAVRRCRIYVRISRDRKGEVSTHMQIAQATALAERRGWEVVEVYTDAGLSAFKQRVRRPNYERLLNDVGEGEAVIVYKLDRMARSVREFVRFTEHLDQRGAVFVSVHDPVDTSTPIGKAVLGVLAVFAQLESEQTRLRVQGAHAELAERGLPHGGRRPFGHEHDGRVRPGEAEAVVDAAGRFLDGESLRSIARDWNARGIRTAEGGKKPEGGLWASNVVGNVLRSPRLAGYRVHHGTLYRSEVIEPLVDEDTWLRLSEALGDSRRRVDRTTTKHLLSGILRCGRCGHGLMFKPRGDGGKTRYGCLKREEVGSCGGVAIGLEATEAFVRELVLEAIDAGALAATGEAQDTVRLQRETSTSIAEDQAALEGLSRDFYVDRVITREEYSAARGPLVERIGQAETMLARLGQQGPAPDLPATGEELRTWWEHAEVPERRRVIGLVIDHVTVRPVERRGNNRFDPARLEPYWRA